MGAERTQIAALVALVVASGATACRAHDASDGGSLCEDGGPLALMCSCRPCLTVANSTASSCDATGACTQNCIRNYVWTGTACEPIVAPRLVAPVSASRTTSQTPTFRWELGPHETGARLQFCSDRACAGRAGPTFDATAALRGRARRCRPGSGSGTRSASRTAAPASPRRPCGRS